VIKFSGIKNLSVKFINYSAESYNNIKGDIKLIVMKELSYEDLIIESELAENKAITYSKNNNFVLANFWKAISKRYKKRALSLTIGGSV